MTLAIDALRDLAERYPAPDLPPLSQALVDCLALPPDLPGEPDIAQVAAVTGVSAHALRYYERTGLMVVGRDSAGHRVYDHDALARVVFITRLRASDMPIRTIPVTSTSSSRGRVRGRLRWRSWGVAMRLRRGMAVEGFDPKTIFGRDMSLRYDAHGGRGDERETVAFLAGIAGRRRALEFAVGTGRIALPLSRAGVPVDGIEVSQHMIDRMREKPGGDRIEVTIGNMAEVRTVRTYQLVYLVYNTIGNLLTQDEQVRCFENAARHLSDDGVFVLECQVPTAPSRPGRQYVDAKDVGVDHVGLAVCRYDPVSQILDESHVRIAADGIVLEPIRVRLAHPPEFDLMARIAGIRLRDRWGGWEGEPFTAASWRHVSVYQRAAG